MGIETREPGKGDLFFKVQFLIQDQVPDQSKILTYPGRQNSDFYLLSASVEFSRQTPWVCICGGGTLATNRGANGHTRTPHRPEPAGAAAAAGEAFEI